MGRKILCVLSEKRPTRSSGSSLAALKGKKAMKRRDFCKLVAGAASAALLPVAAKISEARSLSVPAAFDKYTENYAAFCNTPANKRVFYTLRGKRRQRIVPEKLSDATWQPDTIGQMQHVPRLPVPGGS